MKEYLESAKQESFERQLSNEEIVRLLYLSFMLAQGSMFAQRHILKFARFYYGKQLVMDASVIKETFFKTILSDDKQLKLATIKKHSVPKSRDILVEESTLEQRYLKILAEVSCDYSVNHLRFVASSTWQNDYEFICTRMGRPNRDDEHAADMHAGANIFLKDKYFSYGVHFLLRQDNDTGNEAYNRLFRLASTIPLHSESKNHVKGVIQKYNEKHPDSRVTSEEHSRLSFISNEE